MMACPNVGPPFGNQVKRRFPRVTMLVMRMGSAASCLTSWTGELPFSSSGGSNATSVVSASCLSARTRLRIMDRAFLTLGAAVANGNVLRWPILIVRFAE